MQTEIRRKRNGNTLALAENVYVILTTPIKIANSSSAHFGVLKPWTEPIKNFHFIFLNVFTTLAK